MNFDSTKLGEIKQGYTYTENDKSFHCMFCGQSYTVGDVYKFGDRLVDACTAVKLHIQDAHDSVFNMLIAEDKKTTGLTDVQSEILSCFYHGMSYKEIAVKTKTSVSTVRFQRFSLREKAKQAKIFLALYELMEEKAAEETIPEIHPGATMIDERYMISVPESEEIIKYYFISTDPPVLRSFPIKEKKKLVVLRVIANQFERDKTYGEREVNRILKPIYEDYVTIRRYLIEYGFMDRTHNCGEYWLK